MPVRAATDAVPRVVDTERVLTVYVHPDAIMTVPKSEWLWQLNWANEPERSSASDRMLAASMGESYRYLVMECDKDEAWHRIQQMRKAVLAYDRNDDQE